MELTPDLALAEWGLDALERLEVRGLVWGLVEGALSDDEVRDTLRTVLDSINARRSVGGDRRTIDTTSDLQSRLIDLKMLFPVAGASGQQIGWRTRMAEGVRLIAQLRQLFPKHYDSAGLKWATASTLVADYRFLRRPRRYPKRDIAPTAVKSELADVITDAGLLDAVGHWLAQMDENAGLARFQIDATRRLIETLQGDRRTGTLVSAGTGSGKTLAFYLAALAWTAHRVAQDPEKACVQVLAIYPRNELLKDQLAEVYDQCRKFDGWLARQGGRPLRIGVHYGETHETVQAAGRDWKNSVCPFFVCPQCAGDLRIDWAEAIKDVTRLSCERCKHYIDESTLVITRKTLAARPPDILFTSVEMLNRDLAHPDRRHLFGVGSKAARPPDLVLMDEVHLYSQTYGAQMAYLTRRWWAASGYRSSFVGLSATISDGQSFFANLTGMKPAAVEEIKPFEDDMMEEGAEYLLALRGDPVSQSALLSTTIQTLMLGARLLDTRNDFDRKNNPFFGWRAFAFTDQMDATNRLYRDLLDAEGRDVFGRENFKKHPRGGLAFLRTPHPAHARRYAAGQDWRVPRQIGHDLTRRLSISRTTADDRGVDTESEIVIATAALEVGFDDPAVGLVLQHKAPRDIASFLQRKGRGGRTRHMRPWTVVVLSDYGRDRLAYQAYDELFEPALPSRQLPIANRYVQRMQAVYALFDWLAELTHRDATRDTLWRVLARPQALDPPEHWTAEAFAPIRDWAKTATQPVPPAEWKLLQRAAVKLGDSAGARAEGAEWFGANWLKARLQQIRVLKLLETLLTPGEQGLERLAREIGRRLDLSPEETNVILWSQPRPLILGAIPTLTRRLSSTWSSAGRTGRDHVASHPLPDYVPNSLFSDLSLPELRLELPESMLARRKNAPYLPVQQALSEFAPGKVSRRYDQAVWLGVASVQLQGLYENPAPIIDEAMPLEAWYDGELQRPLQRQVGGQTSRWLALRPIAAKLRKVEFESGVASVADTSNAHLEWSSHLQAPRGGRLLQAPPHIGICRLIRFAVAHTHAAQTPALVRRYAVGSRAELKLSHGHTQKRVIVHWRFEHGGEPAGVGFEIDTDAIVLALNLPQAPHTAIDWDNAPRLRAARAARYRHEVHHDPALIAEYPSVFIRGWLGQIFQIGALLVARTKDWTIRQALDALAQSDSTELPILLNVLQAVFQLPAESDEVESPDRLRQTLRELLSDEDTRALLRNIARVLVDPIDATWDDWLSTVMRRTLGAACLEAIQQCCPQVDPDSLVIDIETQLRDDGSPAPHPEIWISEINPGGNGLIEQVVEVMAATPERFYRQLEAAIGVLEFEWVDRQLSEVVQWIGSKSPDADLVELVRRVREAAGAGAAQSAFGDLRAALVRRGHVVFHGYGVALAMRLLRPGSPEELDRVVAELQQEWSALEDRYGLEIDVRVMAALSIEGDRLDRAFAIIGSPLPTGEHRANWRFGVLMGVLWARGHALRAQALPFFNRFADGTNETERLLLEQWLTPRAEPIDPEQPDWAESARERLRAFAEVSIAAAADRATAWMPEVIRTLVVEPVQFDYLNVYARLSGVKRRSGILELVFSIPEGAG